MFKRTKVSVAAALALGGVAIIAASPVWAQETQRIEITGSSIKRVDAETALPVTTIGRVEIERSGYTTAQDIINSIPSNFGGLVVASNVGSTGNASGAALRGLSSKYTLVLLNGRRVANFAFGNSPVDLNSIPLSAVDRIEILRDGASAVYGSDAVAGVINFILRKDYQGLEIAGYTTLVDHPGGGNTQSVDITGGFGDLTKQGFNGMFTAHHEESEVLKAKDRTFANSANRPDLGINKASARNGIPNFNFTDTLGNGYGSRVGANLASVAPTINPQRYNGCNNVEFALVVLNSTQCGTDYVKYIDLIPLQNHDNLVARGSFQLNNDNQVYAEAMYVKDHTQSTYSPAPYTINMTYPAGGRFYPTSFVVPKGTKVGSVYTDPVTGVVTNIPYKLADGTLLAPGTILANDVTVTPTGSMSGTWRTVAGGGRSDITDATTNRFVLGMKGLAAGWDYDMGLTSSTNHGDISFGPGQYSYAALTPLVNAGSINVFGSQDATSLALLNSALLHGLQQSADSKATSFDFSASRDIYNLPAGPLGFAWGGSVQKITLDQVSMPVLASGDQVGGAGPIPSVSGGRTVYGLFCEFAIPVVKTLDLSLAARYDNYKNDFGTSFNNLSPKASLRFQPSKEVLARASYGQGYRAPTLFENLRPFTSGNNTNANWSDPIRCPGGVPINNSVGTLQDECNIQQPTALSGSTALKPEKSTQYSFGMVFSPMTDFSMSFDYWNVQITDAIVQKSEIQVLSNPTQFKDFIYRYDPAQFPNGYVDPGNGAGAIAGSQNPAFPIAYVFLPYDNASKFFAAGVDVNLQYRMKLTSIGTAGVNFDGTLYTKHGYQNFGSPEISDIGTYQDFGPVPKWRHVLTFALTSGPWNHSLTNNYTEGYLDYTNPSNPGLGTPTYPTERHVGSYSTWDWQTAYKQSKDVDVVVGVKNLLDQDPPSSRTEVNFQTGYDAQFTNPLGRTYYTRLRYKF
jgi:iron complex outermembrane receptor protein